MSVGRTGQNISIDLDQLKEEMKFDCESITDKRNVYRKQIIYRFDQTIKIQQNRSRLRERGDIFVFR